NRPNECGRDARVTSFVRVPKNPTILHRGLLIAWGKAPPYEDNDELRNQNDESMTNNRKLPPPVCGQTLPPGQKRCLTPLIPKWIIVVFAAVSAGCLSSTIPRWSTDTLIESAGNRELADQLRIRVLDEVVRRELDTDQYKKLGAVSAEVVGSPMNSPLIRQRVLYIVTDYYRDEAAQWLGAALLNSSEKQLRGKIIDALVKLGDEKAISYLILSLAEPEAELLKDKTAIVRAVESIAGKPIKKVALEYLADGKQLKTRIAALVCLLEQNNRSEVITEIKALPIQDDFIEELQFWAGQFGYVPTNIMRYYQCRLQQTILTEEQLEKLRQRALLLRRREGYVFDVRDSYLLAAINEKKLNVSRAKLIGRIHLRLAELEHTKRPYSYKGASDDYAEGFIDQCNLLRYTDLIRIKLLLESLSQKEFAGQIKMFLQQDFCDTTSETGGLSFLEQDKIVFKKYEPGSRQGDNQYVESAQMVRDGVLCIARWHCHTDKWRSWELAGPGIDDLRYADWINCPVVVLTRLSEKKCNVDYFTPEGIVVDIGNYCNRSRFLAQ
ncbi:MAG: HEAT repeat domain-containing protein, partial [Sedimentisphaerales bacterium]|nr:HEAT repeat domain-containing protein [Sedimentisphaerales bacterium]